MRMTHDVVATVGEYKDSSTGEKRKRFVKVGALFTSDKGEMSVKLDALPLGPEWSGWLKFYPVKSASRGAGREPAAGAAGEPDDIPF